MHMDSKNPDLTANLLLFSLASHKKKLLYYQDFVVRHRVCSQSIPVKSNTVCGCTGVHCIDLSCEQPVMGAPETSFGTIYKKRSVKFTL